MSTDTKIKTLIFNKLTQEQYNNADRVPTEFYLTPDTSIDSSEKGAPNGVASLGTNGKVLTEQIPVATASALGGVKPDGNTITVTEDGTISVPVSAEVATKAELQALDSSKANTSLSNLSTAGKDLASGLGMPSNRYIDLTLGASGATYTAPANGYFCLIGNSGINGNFQISFHNQTANFKQTILGNFYADWVSTYIPAKNGDVVLLLYNNLTAASHSFLFIYAEGAE